MLAYSVSRVLAPFLAGEWAIRDVVGHAVGALVALGEGDLLLWSARTTLGGDSGLARLWIPVELVNRGWLSTLPAPHAAGLLSIPARLAVERGVASLSGLEVASLRVGDVVVPDPVPDAELVTLRLRGASTIWRARLREPNTLEIESAELCAPAYRSKRTGGGMDEDESVEAMLRAAGDAPIAVSVEVGRIELPLAEIAALRPGEVLSTGRALGERVALRIGERTVAWGELVDLEGEIGVRILELRR